MYLQRWFILMFCLLLAVTGARAAAPTHLWSQNFGDEDPQNGQCVAVDGSGNVIVAGQFSGTVDFGGGPLTSTGGPLGPADLYIVKFDAAGNHIWSQRYGNDQVQELFGLALDDSDNIVIVGSFRGTIDFGGGQLTTAGLRDIYVAKFAPFGNHLWSKSFGDSSDYQEAQAVAVDDSGSVVVTGYFQGTVDFGGGQLTSTGNEDIFVAKFTQFGNHLWSKRFGDSSGQYARSVAVHNDGGITVTGNFEGAVDFGTGQLTSAGSTDIFVAHFTQFGNCVWSKRFGDADTQQACCVAVDDSGNIVVTGQFYGSTDFGGGLLTSAGSTDIFVANFTVFGNHVWSKRFGDSNGQYARCVVSGNSGNIIVTGFFAGTVDFGGGPLTSSGDYDIFTVNFTMFGNHLWSKRHGDSDRQIGQSVASDDIGNVVMTGHFMGTVDFGGGILTSAGSFDIYVALLVECNPTVSSIVDVGNDQGRWVRINFLRSGCDVEGSPSPILQYEAFRRIDPLPASTVMETVDQDHVTSMVSDGSVLLQGWEYVGAVPAHGDWVYNMIAPTLADSSIASGMHWSVFFIRAATADPLTFFDSAQDSGYSLDNLAPAPPSGFSVAYNTGAGVQLTWDPSEDEDFDYYCIYRGSDPGFEPGPENLVGATSETEWTDVDPRGWDHHYKITAVDFSGNESEESGPDLVTGAETPAAPSGMVLQQNTPNPFNPATSITYGIPNSGRVTLTIYDVEGKFIRTIVDAVRPAGFETVSWDATDSRGNRVRSGIYFYSLSLGSEVITKKMLLLK